MHSSALSVVALQPPGSPVQPDGEEVPPAALPALLQAAAVAHLAALPAPAAHHWCWRPAELRVQSALGLVQTHLVQARLLNEITQKLRISVITQNFTKYFPCPDKLS